jgi:hypothetical protein
LGGGVPPAEIWQRSGFVKEKQTAAAACTNPETAPHGTNVILRCELLRASKDGRRALVAASFETPRKMRGSSG